MLEGYKKKYHQNNFQYILVDDFGAVLETDNNLFTVQPKSLLQECHPFFEILSGLLQVNDETFEFSCINLDFENEILIADITIISQNKNENLVILENLTKHYNNYQLTAQTRNESIINSQVLELKNEYLLEKETFKNNFIANFSHQLRNPITASIIFSDLLINSNLSADQKNYLDIIQSANKDLKTRIEDILDISKIESGKLSLNEKVFDFSKLLNDIIAGYKILANNKGLEFNFNLEEGLPEYVKADQYRLKQIIANLITNAINNTHAGSITLNVSLNYVRAKKANIHFEVIDTGIGIEASKIDTIFERFTKLDAAARNDKRIGLGLSIVKYLISEMQGNINVESEVNAGSKFIFNLSFKLSNHNESIKEELIKYQVPKLNKKYHILLVEDSELIQLTILKILAATGHFYINIISKGEELVSNIINKDVDLILLANTIQDFSAIDLAASVRNLSREYKKTPIIVLSTQAFKEDLKSFKRAKINDVVTKPFDETILLEKIYNNLK
ncbi:response regulator [Algibacter amylolyticus]|uniref:histidine kinase n=1 Tax=Algibacter amylolyticus TaxID=1608400 RepID=A0A5M7B3R1_9FLAO|nr:ATP-binding protein [Algibacter amylolyticus]KAA5824072.1 response regulator [Algibacter amylolyticus]MBB5269628.1 signal transduction histidine kinase [Algibacter amylolyticus]TSJ74549.1 response regulator [Algibacter amylolyticus]